MVWFAERLCILQIEHNCLISFYSLHNQFSYRYTYQLHTENEITDAFKYTCIYFYIEYLTFQNYFVAFLINLEKSFSTCFFLPSLYQQKFFFGSREKIWGNCIFWKNVSGNFTLVLMQLESREDLSKNTTLVFRNRHS